MTPRTASRTDTNQSEIVSALRKAGCSVLSLASLGKGVPDLLVAYRGHLTLLEVKHGKGRLNEQQLDWHDAWNGPVWTVTNPEFALRVVRDYDI